MDHIHKTTWDGLNQGYGAEDIAILHNLNADDVRLCVHHFRKQRKLAPLYGRTRGKMRLSHAAACQPLTT